MSTTFQTFPLLAVNLKSKNEAVGAKFTIPIMTPSKWIKVCVGCIKFHSKQQSFKAITLSFLGISIYFWERGVFTFFNVEKKSQLGIDLSTSYLSLTLKFNNFILVWTSTVMQRGLHQISLKTTIFQSNNTILSRNINLFLRRRRFHILQCRKEITIGDWSLYFISFTHFEI